MTARQTKMHVPTHIKYCAHNGHYYTCPFTPDRARELHNLNYPIWIQYKDLTEGMLTLAYVGGSYGCPLLCLDEMSRHIPFN